MIGVIGHNSETDSEAETVICDFPREKTCGDD